MREWGSVWEGSSRNGGDLEALVTKIRGFKDLGMQDGWFLV